jgi:hypothetical protein
MGIRLSKPLGNRPSPSRPLPDPYFTPAAFAAQQARMANSTKNVKIEPVVLGTEDKKYITNVANMASIGLTPLPPDPYQPATGMITVSNTLARLQAAHGMNKRATATKAEPAPKRPEITPPSEGPTRARRNVVI